MNLLEFARTMPKAELHIHLEGSIHPATLLKLAERNGIPLPARDEAGLHDFYHFRDFLHFIDIYLTITHCLRTPADYQLIAYEFGADRARQNIRYSEVTFTPCTNIATSGLPWAEILGGLNTGREQARQEFGIDWRWVFDINRGEPQTQEAVFEIVLAAYETEGVVGFGLGGDEVGYPTALFAGIFEKAHRAGLPRVPHAGEIAGPKSVWDAITLLHADRIGHGVRSIEDPKLLRTLAKQQIPLEICPTSNIRLGVYPNYAAHPLRRLWEAGVLVTINSDDPPMFGTDLNHEYELMVEQFDFGADELEQFSLNALRASMLSPKKKGCLETEYRLEFAKLRGNLR